MTRLWEGIQKRPSRHVKMKGRARKTNSSPAVPPLLPVRTERAPRCRAVTGAGRRRSGGGISFASLRACTVRALSERPGERKRVLRHSGDCMYYTPGKEGMSRKKWPLRRAMRRGLCLSRSHGAKAVVFHASIMDSRSGNTGAYPGLPPRRAWASPGRNARSPLPPRGSSIPPGSPRSSGEADIPAHPRYNE